MSTLNTTTEASRPTLGAGDVGKSYFETDSNKILVWDGSAWNEWNSDQILSGGFNNNFSASFDGVDDSINCGVISTLSQATAFSLAFWFKPATSGAGAMLGARQNAQNTYSFYNNGFYIASQGVTPSSKSQAYTAPSGTGWHYYVLSYDAGSATLYIDGLQAVSATGFPPRLFTNTSHNFHIGTWGPLTGSFASEGLYDEVALWSSALDSSNATALWNSDGTGFDITSDTGSYNQASNLIAYWRCGDGSGDSSSSGSPADGVGISTVKNIANPGTFDGTGANGAVYASKSADSTNVPY